MTGSSRTRLPSRRRAAAFVCMLLFGVAMASWVTRTPAVRDAVGASTGQMGLILFGLSVGSMLGVLSSGSLVRRHGTRPVIVVGCTVVVLSVACIGLATAAGSGPGVFAGMLLMGAGMGLSEIALNIEGAAVEQADGRPFLPVLHGAFSLGTVVGALLGMAVTGADVPVVWHLLAVAVVLVAMAAWALAGIPSGTGRQPRRLASEPKVDRPSVWRDGGLVLIAVIVLAMAFAEGSANDWLPILFVDTHDADPVYGSGVFVAFAAMMTLGRFAGGPVVVRFGRRAVMMASALLAIVGVLTVSFAPNVAVAAVAVVLWGLGASLGFPVAISAAGDDPERSAERVSAVATSGYVAFLVGPPLLGYLGDQVGLPRAMLVVVALLAVAVVCAARLPAPARPALEDAPVPVRVVDGAG